MICNTILFKLDTTDCTLVRETHQNIFLDKLISLMMCAIRGRRQRRTESSPFLRFPEGGSNENSDDPAATASMDSEIALESPEIFSYKVIFVFPLI